MAYRDVPLINDHDENDLPDNLRSNNSCRPSLVFKEKKSADAGEPAE